MVNYGKILDIYKKADNPFWKFAKSSKLSWDALLGDVRYTLNNPYKTLNSGFIINPYRYVAGGDVGGWIEDQRTTLGSAGASIDVTSINDKRYYQTLAFMPVSGSNVQPRLRFNADSGNNYASRISEDGGSDGTSTSTSAIIAPNGIFTGNMGFESFYTSNLSSKEKLVQRWHVSNRPSTGAGTAPTRKEQVGKWANTADAIDQMEMNSVSNTFASGAEMVVLEWDPADTHTTNFWEELASVDLSGGAADTISSSFTAKKYLWVQGYLEASGAIDVTMRLGSTSLDTGSNYAHRVSDDGSADGTSGSRTSVGWNTGSPSTPIFVNCFIINNASNEKLFHGVGMVQGTAGASTAPNRRELAGKWANTSNQADILGFVNIGAGDFGTNSLLRVWGSD